MRLSVRIPLLSLLCAVGLALGLTACGRSGTSATRTTTPATGHRPGLLSIFQSDGALNSNPVGTLATFKQLGVQVVRYEVQWSYYSPDPGSRTKPAHFDAANPGAKAYQGVPIWGVLDAVDRDVSAAGMRLYLTLTSPAPLWATSADVPAAVKKDGCPICDRWEPSPADYRQWVEAVGKRYDGHYTPPGQSTPLPRVSFWSIWNEPNFGPNLTPQSTETAGDKIVDTAAPQYRKLVEAGWQGLAATGHSASTDTILIGETAPRGYIDPGLNQTTPPLQFIRDLYCVDGNFQPVTGSVATALGCPTNGSGTAFAEHNPALFKASGWADHPYPDGYAPNVLDGSASDTTGWADFSRLSHLEASLDKAAAAWGSSAQLKIYNTEFGYFTDPPLKPDACDCNSIPPATAAIYLNEAEYLSWEDPRVESYDQYLLQDPDLTSTSGQFDTGIDFSSGKPIPGVFDAYRLPLWLPKTTGTAGQSLRVWGCARPALTASEKNRQVEIQFSTGTGGFRTVQTVTVHPASSGCYFDTPVKFPASGNVRLAYRQGTDTISSRTQAITLG